MTTETNRQATLKELHRANADTVLGLGLANAIVMMAIRYGAARALEDQRDFDYELVSQARRRRFRAMQRLVMALDRKS